MHVFKNLTGNISEKEICKLNVMEGSGKSNAIRIQNLEKVASDRESVDVPPKQVDKVREQGWETGECVRMLEEVFSSRMVFTSMVRRPTQSLTAW